MAVTKERFVEILVELGYEDKYISEFVRHYKRQPIPETVDEDTVRILFKRVKVGIDGWRS